MSEVGREKGRDGERERERSSIQLCPLRNNLLTITVANYTTIGQRRSY